MTSFLRRRDDARRFAAGYSAHISGIPFRVVQGRKSADDLKLEWLTDRGWVPVDMAAGGLLADFFYENEHRLYTHPNALGGEKYMRFLQDCVRLGWQEAMDKLVDEKAAAMRRRLGLDECA